MTRNYVCFLIIELFSLYKIILELCKNKQNLSMNKQIVSRISSKLYFDLFERGGDKLVAVYCTIKSSRKGDIKYYSYKSKNNKFVGGYALIRAKTSLSLSVIEKHVPTLIEMGLCSIEKNGDFSVLGGEKVKEMYSSYKLVPVGVESSVIKTAYNSFAVRIFSAEKQQLRQIEIKQNRSELLRQVSNPKSNELYKKACKLQKKYGDEITVIDKTVLSNQGYAYIKDGSEDYKSKGSYWKNKLEQKGLIKSTRRFKKIQIMSFEQYKILKSNNCINYNNTYYNGYLVEEEVSSFYTKNIYLP